MATRFGGARAGQGSSVRKNWVVGLFASICVVILGSMVLLLRSADRVDESDKIPNVLAAPVVDSSVRLLVASQRIEEGTQLSPGLFQEEPVPPEKKPLNAFEAQNKAALVGMYASRLIVPNIPLTREDVTDQPKLGVTNLIPAGYRAVTIGVDIRTSVEGFTRPNTRVDVLFTFTDRDGQKKVATIVRFAKILSYGGQTATAGSNNREGNGASTITLLVTERDAQRIELAKTTGQLSLILVGDSEQQRVSTEPGVVGINEILGTTPPSIKQSGAPIKGHMIVTDPKTGQKVSYCLRNGEWKTDCDE